MIKIKGLALLAGGNRSSNAADWQHRIFAFGSGRNVAIWDGETSSSPAVTSLLRGHTDVVTAVRLLDLDGSSPLIVTGSSDKSVRLWSNAKGRFQQIAECLHTGSINTISALPEKSMVAVGSADASLTIWRMVGSRQSVSLDFEKDQQIALAPRILPLTCALTSLNHGSVLLAVAGTNANIYLYLRQGEQFQAAATLSGHEGWIRSLDFTKESVDEGSDILLASASQDKYIRLWRIHKGQQLPEVSAGTQDPTFQVIGRSLSNKPHFVGKGESLHSVTFEALLIGSEDWIYTSQWRLSTAGPKLLTASADNSISVWGRSQESGFWNCEHRLGELSVQKGSTTATGSAGGFWIGIWSPDGQQVACLSRTGSWRMWSYSDESSAWGSRFGLGGHIREVKSIAWASDGSYLLSTGSDQTTRLWAAWKGNAGSWHELARPQIHGYDLNCLDTLGNTRFISGADEKLLRVFDMPKGGAQMIVSLAGVAGLAAADLPETASIPVLGLSNKAIPDADQVAEPGRDGDDNSAGPVTAGPEFDLENPPIEDILARHTLWPEYEKLYGHGYEISAVAASHDHKLVATACRASSIDHAVIRIYETRDWRELRPALSGHTLTVTSMAFSPDNKHLLSVGRDRQWIVYERESTESNNFKLKHSNPKGHSRMILDCSWAPGEAGSTFATAARDKAVKIWHKGRDDADFHCRQTIATHVAATAVRFAETTLADGVVVLAHGSDAGEVGVLQLDASSWSVKDEASLSEDLRPSGTVTALRWRPQSSTNGPLTLAASSDDHSVRIYEVDLNGAS